MRALTLVVLPVMYRLWAMTIERYVPARKALVPPATAA